MTALGTALLEPRDLVDGAWAEPGLRLPGELVDQVTGRPVQERVASDGAAVHRAVAAAWAAARDVEGLGPTEQRRWSLETAAALLEERAAEIAVQDTLGSGVPIGITALFAGSLAGTFRDAAAHLPDLAPVDLSRDGRPVVLHRLPLGPAAVLAPWNAPTAVAAKKAAYAWAAGCPVVLKPSPWAPHGSRLLVEAMAEAAAAAGLPPSAVQLVHGDAEVGRQLAADPRIRAVSFTGSRSGGRAVAAAAAGGLAALQIEAGSNNPALVLADADVEETAAALGAGTVKLNGAWCESPGTVFAPAARLADLHAALEVELARQVIGSPLDAATTFGPQSNPVQHATLRARLAELEGAGASVVPVGQVPGDGLWTAPTLVTGAPAELVREELFGPVLVLRPYATVEGALAEAAALETGLAGYVFTGSVPAGLDVGRRLPAGEVKVNGTSLLDMSPDSAQTFWFGSGVGGHGDRDLARFFTGARIVGRDVESPL